MSHIDPHVPAHEHAVLRLFTLDTGTSGGRTLRDALETGGPAADRAAASALGAQHVESKWLGLAALRDLEEIGIDAYLQQGYDVPADQITPIGERLDAATGHILVVPSRAFGGLEATLSPADFLVPLASFVLDATVEPARPMNPAEPGQPDEDPAPAPPETKGAKPRPVVVFGILLLAAVIVGLVARQFVAL